jgi:hypothetical protein
MDRAKILERDGDKEEDEKESYELEDLVGEFPISGVGGSSLQRAILRIDF